jgi:hypothetical protein
MATVEVISLAFTRVKEFRSPYLCPQEQGSQVILQNLVPLHLVVWLSMLKWRYSIPLPHGVNSRDLDPETLLALVAWKLPFIYSGIQAFSLKTPHCALLKAVRPEYRSWQHRSWFPSCSVVALPYSSVLSAATALRPLQYLNKYKDIPVIGRGGL